MLKLALNASGDECRVNALADHDAGVRLATARHSSQVSQLPQVDSTSLFDACECIVQSAGIGAWVAMLPAPDMLDYAAAVAAMFTAICIAMTLPAQPRKGSMASIKAINRYCIEPNISDTVETKKFNLSREMSGCCLTFEGRISRQSKTRASLHTQFILKDIST